MPPSVTELGIEVPAYIRKIDNRNYWHPQEADGDLTLRSQLVAKKTFNEIGKIYSLWLISNAEEFYGVVASLTTNATPKDRNIDFIWITKNELNDAGIIPEKIPEGQCYYVRNLHFNAEINQGQARKLCYLLMQNNRDSHRCKKQQTKLILVHQEQKGCKATDAISQSCKCENP
jgi:hypothetical protein